MAPVPWTIRRQSHPGSSKDDIEKESASSSGHQVGSRRDGNRNAGTIGTGLSERLHDEGITFEEKARSDKDMNGADADHLLTIRDIVQREKDYVVLHPKLHIGARYVFDVSEDWIKQGQAWPINKKKQEAKEEKEKNAKKQKTDDDDADKKHDQDGEKANKNASNGQEQSDHEQGDGEDQSKSDDNKSKKDTHGKDDKSNDQSKIEEATDKEFKTNQSNPNKSDRSHNSRHSDKQDDKTAQLSPTDQALLDAVRAEAAHISQLKNNDGKGVSPLANTIQQEIAVDEQDQFTPDNWIPRSQDLVRLTGKHPLNAEPHLSVLFKAGLITPNKLHYVRNHGPVPRLQWEDHKLYVESSEFIKTPKAYTMEQVTSFDWINIPVALACDGNRRKELNLIKRSKGFNWGPGGISCAYWKGILVRDILKDCGVTSKGVEEKRWVYFEGAEQLSEGKYGTSIPFDYIMDESNDVMLAYEMNNTPLFPDHGYPLRLIVPGYVGGRCVKWLEKIRVTDKESDNHYHIWDNRVLPSFVTEKDGPFAEAMFNHPDTACNEQNLNSIICVPAHGEQIPLADIIDPKKPSYRIEGIAYNGGGQKIQKVEVSLDGGHTWIYASRRYPDNPMRHDHKFWAWLHWHVDIKIVDLLSASQIVVRAWNVFKNTQPEHPTWNLMGMMNNCYYRVIPEIASGQDGSPVLTFKHPVEPGTGEGGWMQPSLKMQISSAKDSSDGGGKQFTQEEVEKHDNEKDCWIVIGNKVYDATSVLDWHPGGAHAILSHAGKVHMDTTNEYESIHDDYATKLLEECSLGSLTDKAKIKMKQDAERTAKLMAKEQEESKSLGLKKHQWMPATLSKKEELSHDTRKYTFEIPHHQKLGIGVGQHILIGIHFDDKMVFRPYTPTKPILPAEDDGTFELVVKTYFPDKSAPGGTLGNYLDAMKLGERVDIKGPTGDIIYKGKGTFEIEGEQKHFDEINLLGGGTGGTPHYQLICRILKSEDDKTKINFVYANKSEDDILMRDDFEELANDHKEQLKILNVLSKPSDKWEGAKGHVDEKVLSQAFTKANDGTSVGTFLCGPPPMINAVLPVLKQFGFENDESLFGF